MNATRKSFLLAGRCAAWLVIAGSLPALAQSVSGPPNPASEEEIAAKINALSASLEQTRSELAESREEIKQLRVLLEQVSQRLGSSGAAVQSAPVPAKQSAQARNAATERPKPDRAQSPARITQDDWDVLNARMAEQRQIKVESSSKFPLTLSGIALLNAFITAGSVDNLDDPAIALRNSGSAGSTGLSLRQSIIGLEGSGPRILGADTSADVQADFFGGLPSGYGSTTSGIMRLRLARFRMDWDHTSIVGGLDTPFFSPGSPSSYLTLATPAFSAAGNLWTWTPTIRIEQRFDTSLSELKIEAGVLDVPSYAAMDLGIRIPSPGERSRQPAYSVRFSANGRNDDRPVSLGVSAIYLTERFPGAVNVTGGGGSLDWRFPLFPHTELSGEFFEGKGLDGFGGIPVPAPTVEDYTRYITASAPALARIKTLGGWSQLKIKVNERSEFNIAGGSASRDTAAFRQAALGDAILQSLAYKNQSLMVNYIFRPRSDLVFSPEYRRLWTHQISGPAVVAGQVGLTAGFIF